MDIPKHRLRVPGAFCIVAARGVCLLVVSVSVRRETGLTHKHTTRTTPHNTRHDKNNSTNDHTKNHPPRYKILGQGPGRLPHRYAAAAGRLKKRRSVQEEKQVTHTNTQQEHHHTAHDTTRTTPQTTTRRTTHPGISFWGRALALSPTGMLLPPGA